MNSATIVTSLRIALSPVFFVLFTTTVRDGKASPVAIVALWSLFAIIESTDFVDGRLARKHNMVTDLGKILDPFADSFARLTYFLSFLVTGLMPGWVFLLVLYRDLGVSFTRLLAMKKGVAMAAQVSGKIKAGIYAAAGIAGLALITAQSIVPGLGGIAKTIAALTWWASAAAAVWTMIDYAAAYRKIAGKL